MARQHGCGKSRWRIQQWLVMGSAVLCCFSASLSSVAPASAECLPMAAHGEAGRVTLHVARTSARGLCVWMMNGLNSDILLDPILEWQVRQPDGGPQESQFRAVLSDPRGREIQQFAAVPLLAGGSEDLGDISPNGAPAGRYRLCLGYVVLRDSWYQRVCSQEFAPPRRFPECPLLPEGRPSGSAAVYLAPATNTPGVACARVINGFDRDLTYGGWSVQLQRKAPWVPWFRDVTGGIGPGFTVSSSISLPPGGILDMRIPRFDPPINPPLPAGPYRACFRFRVEGENHEVCSTEVTLE